ncbi:hypothetical protein [[Kitasatospora] papulosa]|uniref:hypothetical protein n=1 Tax=[Kitasatospora] papulosa TaxID=1464011 RepID=UPI0036CCAE2C
MSPTPTNPAALLREAADQLRDVAPQISGPLAGLADPVAAWLEAEAAAPITAEHSTRCVDPQCTTLAALTVARRVLGTTTMQPATAPWPPTGDQRPDHGLYTLLRRAGLTPEAAQQEIDTYTQTILASGDGLRARFEALAADWEKRGEYGDVSLTWGARGIRAVLAAEAQQQQPETEAAPYPTRHRWIAQELEGGDEWMQLASSVNRDYVERRLTSYQTRSPHGLTTRLVRETTTYTVEQPAAEAQQPAPDVAEEATPKARMCPAKHGAWGRICDQADGHTGFHSGPIPNGGVTWEGDAP